jgi:hypothetical protein
MGRIRTIKPEFPHSEGVGDLSRDARLLFLMLFTVVDDEGRARASSRLLASLLYPYDDDASGLIDGWLDELEFSEMIRRYVVDGSTYLEVVKWLEHQKIDKPSRSRLPGFSDGVAKPREASATDLGSRIRDQDLSRSIAGDQPGAQIDLEEVIAAKVPKAAKTPKPAAAPSRFDEFWQAYPRRDGPNPRQPAETRFNALVKTGLDPEMMISEAKKLAVAENARGNIGTRFIPQAVTWLNQARWTDHAAIAALAELTDAGMTIEQAVAMFAKMGVWSRHAHSPALGEPGCKASAELLAKYGLDLMGRKIEVEPV